MTIFPWKRKKPDQPQQDKGVPVDTPTLADPRAYTVDSNKDGIADYKQRPELQSIVKTNQNTTLEEVNAQAEIESTEMDWRGYHYEPSRLVWCPVSPPMINETGIKILIQPLKTAANKLAQNSNISLDYCHISTSDVVMTAIEGLKYNYNEWGIKPAYFDFIIDKVDDLYFLILSRAVDDKQREHGTRRMRLTGDITSAPKPAL